MASTAISGGSFAAAVLGVGTTATAAGAAASSSGSGAEVTIRTAGTQLAQELARTGASTTTVLMVMGLILLLAGLLLVGLTRRHGVGVNTPAGFAPPDLA